jgi:hypothetical protein
MSFDGAPLKLSHLPSRVVCVHFGSIGHESENFIVSKLQRQLFFDGNDFGLVAG